MNWKGIDVLGGFVNPGTDCLNLEKWDFCESGDFVKPGFKNAYKLILLILPCVID